MPIVTSTFTANETQADGRAWIDEKHTDQLGQVYEVLYLGARGAAATNMAARATALSAQITSAEITANVTAISTLGSAAPVTTNYSTVAQNAAALRDFYRVATQTQAVMIGDYMAARTDVQLQVAFSLSAAQVTTLRTNKLTPAASAAATVRATTGA